MDRQAFLLMKLVAKQKARQVIEAHKKAMQPPQQPQPQAPQQLPPQAQAGGAQAPLEGVMDNGNNPIS